MTFCSLWLFLLHPAPSIGALGSPTRRRALSLFRAASYSIVSGLYFIFPFSVDDIGWLFAFVSWE